MVFTIIIITSNYNINVSANSELLDTANDFMLSGCSGKDFCLEDGGGEYTYYAIFFYSNGGSVVNSIVEAVGTRVTEPAHTIKDGYFFKGWYSDIGLTQKYTFSTMRNGKIQF